MKTKLLKNTWLLIKPYWTSEEKWSAFARLIVVLAIATVLVRLQVYANDLIKGLYDAIQKFEVAKIAHYAWQFIGVVVIFSALIAIQGYVFGVLTNRWRRWSTKYFTDKWLRDKSYYQMAVTNHQVDNPDQRISEDIDSLTNVTLTLASGLYTSILQLFTFTPLLWTLGGSLNFMIKQQPYHLPGYLVWCTLAYTVVSTVITMVIGQKLAGLNYQQQHYNANFRFGLMRLREHGEQIALFKGEANEKARLNATYQPVFSNYLNILGVSRNLTFFTTAVDYISMMVGVLFALPLFVQNHLSIGSLMQMSSTVGYEYQALSFIMKAYGTIATWRAVVSRLAEFLEKIDLSQQVASEHLISKQSHALTLKDLTLHLPNGDILQKRISLEILPNEKTLITGASGCGKSTLFKVIAGLWPFASGELHIPQTDKMFLSQKPYLPPGTLLEAITYPRASNNLEAEKVEAYLKILDLAHLIPVLYQTQNWHQVLSLGEQQKVSIIRALLQKPAWLFLDEATASLDEPSEEKVYALIALELPNTTIVSIGHRRSLKEFHQRIVKVDQEHKCETA
ncbi:MAG: ABC-type uncharacterized transport system, permease and ATPase component [Gammaproteobacteria bacterium]|jgi:putative ATP-binding cassette transporter|nr:ABC-type uncharacterized transport system, permease and ATPase component [Gammaproteobacteria bacterium]